MRFTARLLMLTAAALVVVLAWRLSPALVPLLTETDQPRTITPRGDLAADERSTIALFEATRDSVVAISTAARVVDPWTRRSVEQPAGTGSGFLWDDQGHLVTNNHVIEGASRATVGLADGRRFEARLVGRDPSHDLAVLKIDAATLPDPVTIGSSRDLQVGQKVLAIGNPFGLDWTLTTGIVSALDRELDEAPGRTIRGLIQTDAAVNPGNSGGPLLDSAGRLIGMNTAIYSPSGASAGIGFAVPVGTINRVVPQLISQGHYSPPSLGVAFDARVNAMANRQGIEGAVVLGIDPGSPAERAGLNPAQQTGDGRIRLGDVIRAVDGESVETLDDLTARIDLYEPGREVTLDVANHGERREVTLTLEPGG